MPAGTAGDNDDTLGVEQSAPVVNQRTQCHLIVVDINAPAHTVGQALRLLEDFLEHEVRVTAFLYLSEIDIHGTHFRRQFFIEDIHHLQLLAQLHHGNVPVIKINNLVGVLDDRTGIRTEEELAVTNADNERALFPCSNDCIRVALVKQCNGVCTDYLVQCQLHGLQ